MMKKKLVIAAAALAAVAGAWLAKSKLMKPERSRGYVVEASQGTIEEVVEATGSVLPRSRVEIKPPISGRVEKLLVDEGDSVKPGQIIAWMSSTDRAAILDAARAQGPAELAKWQDAYKATPIVASLPGVVILRNAVEGQTVGTGDVLFAVSDRLIVVAQVDESDIGKIRVGMASKIVLDSYPDDEVEGKVFDMLYEGKNTQNVIQYPVKISPEKVPSFFRSQMTANVRFIVRQKKDAVLLPGNAVKEVSGAKQVMIPGAEGEPPAPREVKTGIESGENVEIVSGLAAGEKVFVARSRYVAQKGPQSSPLTMGGRPSGPTGQAPRQRRGGGGNRQ
jgi:membrane fusion protein, macrolide-specific efflux system